jgi:UDP-glucose 6-dehydrogenase
MNIKDLTLGFIGVGTVGRALSRAYVEYVSEVRTYDIIPSKTIHKLEYVLESDLIFVCLPTPLRADSDRLDLSYIEAFFAIASEKNANRNYVLKSTVPVGTTKNLIKQFRLSNTVHCPEFLTQRCALHDACNPSRHIIGTPYTSVGKCGHLLAEFFHYRHPSIPCIVTDSDCSELAKLAVNGYYAHKVSYFNKMQQISSKYNIPWDMLRACMLTDGKISDHHTQVPGPDGYYGFGGACLIPNTPIATPNGWVPLEQVEVGDTVLDHDKQTKVTGVSVRDVNQIVTVRARGREITGSIDHIHVSPNSKGITNKLLGEYRPGDYILIPRTSLPSKIEDIDLGQAYPYVKSWPKSIQWTTNLAWIIGLWLADGSRGVYSNIKDNSIRRGWVVSWTLGEAKKEQYNKCVEILKSLGANPHVAWKVSDGTYGLSETWCIRVRSAWFYRLLDVIGVGTKCHTKRMPLLPENLSQAMIGGWLDGDGSYSNGTIGGHSENTDLILDIDRALLGIGVCAQIGKNKKSIKVSTRKEVEMVCSWTTRHKFDDSRYVRDFEYASPSLRPHPLGWSVVVQDVKFSEGSQVIAIETESGYYIANGHLTHNCLPKDLHALISSAENVDVNMEVAKSVHKQNLHDRKRSK